MPKAGNVPGQMVSKLYICKSGYYIAMGNRKYQLIFSISHCSENLNDSQDLKNESNRDQNFYWNLCFAFKWIGKNQRKTKKA